jgi:hypothetical protein
MIIIGIIIIFYYLFKYISADRNEYIDLKDVKVTKRVFFEFEVENKIIGKVIIGLFGDVVPKTVYNFEQLCTMEKGYGIFKKLKKGFKDSFIHRGFFFIFLKKKKLSKIL